MAKKSKFLSEFKEFAIKGNAIDLAIGVIIGGAFSTITNSLVNDIFMPIIGMFLGGIDFSSWNIALPQLFAGSDPITLNLGTFINTVINFIILALVVFMIVRSINKLREREAAKKAAEEAAKPAEPETPPEPSAEVVLLTEIRDALKNQEK